MLLTLYGNLEKSVKICQTWESSDSELSRENFPTRVYCDDCFEEMDPEGEDSGVMSHEDHESDKGPFGDTCSQCGKTKKEEVEEQE